MPLTRQQFNEINPRAGQLMNDREKKECLLLAADLESEISGLETSDPELFFAAKKLIAQLRWIGLPIIYDEALFYNSFRHYLLEGLELEDLTGDKLIDIATTKLSWQFGYGLTETTQNILRAIRENTQPIGKDLLLVKNETKPARPVVRNWLVDFLRSSPDEPSEIDEMNYLYKNPNAKKLSTQDKKTLSRVLEFYDSIRLVAQETARAQRNDFIVNQEETPSRIEKKGAAQNVIPNIPAQSLPDNPSPSIQQQAPTPLTSFIQPRPMSSTPTAVTSQNIEPISATAKSSSAYREPIEEKDLAGPPAAKPIAPAQSTATTKSGQLTQGNVVDLRDMNK